MSKILFFYFLFFSPFVFAGNIVSVLRSGSELEPQILVISEEFAGAENVFIDYCMSERMLKCLSLTGEDGIQRAVLIKNLPEINLYENVSGVMSVAGQLTSFFVFKRIIGESVSVSSSLAAGSLLESYNRNVYNTVKYRREFWESSYDFLSLNNSTVILYDIAVTEYVVGLVSFLNRITHPCMINENSLSCRNYKESSLRKSKEIDELVKIPLYL